MFTKAILDSVLDLDMGTGFLYRKSGLRADHFHGKYFRVWLQGNKYYSHHIVWCIVHGLWPIESIDHANGDTLDNRPSNIRLASRSNNIANADFGPMRGVERHGAKWRVRIWVLGERIELGSYNDVEEAIAAYQAGAERFFGEFAFHNRSA